MSDTRTNAESERWSWSLPRIGIGSRSGPAGRTLLRRLASLSVAPVIVGLLLGIGSGFILGALLSGQPQVETQIALSPDPPLNPDDPAVDTESYVQGQLLVLRSADLAASVAAARQLAVPPEVAATQVGTTNVVDLQIKVAAPGDAITASQAVIDTYRAQRQQVLDNRLDTAIAVVGRQLSQTPSTSAEYTRLLGLRNSLQLIRDANPDPVSVVLQPRLQDSSVLLRGLRGAFIGAVLGVLVGLLFLLTRRRVVRGPDRSTNGRS